MMMVLQKVLDEPCKMQESEIGENVYRSVIGTCDLSLTKVRLLCGLGWHEYKISMLLQRLANTYNLMIVSTPNSL